MTSTSEVKIPHIPKARTNQCRHIFTNGHQCGSCALRGEKLCFYHTTARRPLPHRTEDGLVKLTFTEPEDLHAVQRSLGEVLRLLGQRELDARDAGPILRTLAIASVNLSRIDRQTARQQTHNAAQPDSAQPAEPVTEVIHDPVLGLIAPAAPVENEPAASSAPAEAAAPSLAELVFTTPLVTVAPKTLADPTDVILLAHDLPVEPIPLFEFAKQEFALFGKEFARRPTPYTLSTGVPLHPLDLYNFALARFDRYIGEQGGNPDRLPLPEEEAAPDCTYPLANEHFCTSAHIA